MRSGLHVRQAQAVTVELRYPVSALCSFHYYSDPAVVKRLHDGGLRLIGDSGAFSALTSGKPIDLDAYIRWGHAVLPYTTWLAGLDEIGNADKTWTRWRTTRKAGLDVVPTLHYGATPRLMDRYVEQGVDFFGLGGMVGRKSEQARLMRWALSMMRYARDTHPGVRFHGWGITHPLLLTNLPWWSVDSSGFGQAYRFGRLNLFDPDTKRSHTAALDGSDVYRLGPLLRKHYGTTAKSVERSTAANRPHVIRVSARSFQLLEDHLRLRHRIPPPTYGVRDPMAGTNVHAVDGSVGNLTAMLGTNVHAALASTSEGPSITREAP